MSELPDGWARVALEDLITPRSDRVSPKEMPDAQFIGMEHVEPHTNLIIETVSASTMASNAARFVAGDVLYGRMRPYLNKVVAPSFDGLASAEFIVFPKLDAIDKQFLLRRLSASDFTEFACSQYEGDRPRVKFDQLGKFDLHLPPRAEQTRIVEKLEDLLSDLDAGVAELKAAQRKLAQYRQSLLKAAVEGALTADWRAARHQSGKRSNPSSPRKRGSSASASGPTTETLDSRFRGNDGHEDVASNGETGATLLQRILTERRTRWEARQLAKFAGQGKTPPKGWKTKYTEPVAPDITDLPALPDGWVWATLDQLLVQLRSGTAETSRRDVTPHPVLKSSAVRQGSIDLSVVNFLNQDQCRTENYLEPGDLLITRLSGSVEYVGCVAIVGDLVPASFQYPDRIFCGKLACLSPQLATHIVNTMRSPQARLRVEKAAKSTAGHKRISLSDLLPFPIPLPSLPEVVALDDVMRTHLCQTEDAEAAATFSLKQSTAQRKNILKAAFAGQLVPQDPDDEPASVLLERIRAERITNDASRKPGSRRKGAKP